MTMTTTTITTGHPRMPLVAALTAGAALVLGGVIGVAWEHDRTPAEHAGSTSVSFGGSTTSDEFAGTTHPYPRAWSKSGSVLAGGSPDGYSTSQQCRGCRR
jgi:hypothetical protein